MFRKMIVITLMLGLVAVSPSYGADVSAEVTRDARNLADWVLNSTDHQNLPFVVIDKRHAQVFVFRPDGSLHGATSALLGVSVGDHTAPGVGKKKLSEISVVERTTPAGRFEVDLGRDTRNSEVLWIDYDSGLSMHIVVTGNVAEKRAQRLASNQPTDRRITYGCVNVSGKFYKEVILPIFKGSNGIVYILPEVESIKDVFGSEAFYFSQR